jgi:hypothetical protein
MNAAGNSGTSPFSTPELDESRSRELGRPGHAAETARRGRGVRSTFGALVALSALVAVGMLGALFAQGDLLGGPGRPDASAPPPIPGSGGSPSEGDPSAGDVWVARANGLCRQGVALLSRQDGAAAERALAIRQAALEGLRDIETPPQAGPTYARMLESWQASIEESAAALRAAKSGDQAGFVEALARVEELSLRGSGTAQDLGLHECPALFTP